MFIAQQHFQEHHQVFAQSMQSLMPQVHTAAEAVVATLRAGHTVFFAGNGGSAADAQHLAAELTGRFVAERIPLSGIALTTDTSALTAIANDYGYQHVFSRQLQGLGRPGDLLVAISCSGESPSIVEALHMAQAKGMSSIGLLGKEGGACKDLCTHPLVVPAQSTARIQEMHILIGHIFCAYVDAAFAAA